MAKGSVFVLGPPRGRRFELRRGACVVLNRSIIPALLGAVALFATASPALAQARCGERSDIIQQLQTRFQETRKATGLASNGALFEIFAAPDGSWTALMTYPNGKTCLMAVGDAWSPTADQPGEPV